MPTAITFNDNYNTLTTSVTNVRRMTCGCGARLAPGEAVGLTEMVPYRTRRAARMCVNCAAKSIARHHFNFCRMSKDYTHLIESVYGEITPAEAAEIFKAEYTAAHAAPVAVPCTEWLAVIV